MKTEILTVGDQTIAALANGLYQGLALTVLVALALRFLGRTNAATRHSIWMATLLLLPAIIFAHYWLDRRGSATALRQGLAPETVALAVLPETLAPTSIVVPAKDRLERARDSESAAATTEVAENSKETPEAPAAPPVPWSSAPIERSEAGRVEPAVADAAASSFRQGGAREVGSLAARLQATLSSTLRRYAQPIYWGIESDVRFPRLAGVTVLAVWLCVFLAKLVQLAGRLYEIRQLKHRSSPAASELTNLFLELRQAMGIRRRVSLRISSAQRSPVVLGFVHPVVLLPPTEMLPDHPGQTIPILRHELAHVGRWDDWANLVQHLIQAALFFHPGVWWISRQLSLEREIACDDQVLHGGGRPKAYALILADLAGRMKRCSPVLAPGVTNNKSQLQQRISMILDTKRNTSPCLAKTRMGFVTASAALLAALAICSGPRLVLAQTASVSTTEPSPKPQPGEAANSAPATVSLGAAEGAPTAAGISVDGDSGPRYKPDVPSTPTPPEAGIVTRPLTPRAPIAVVTAPTALPGVLTVPSGTAYTIAPGAPGYAIATAGGDDGSIEKRLERLERMVHSLMAQQGGLPPGHPFEKGQQWNWNMDQKQFKDMLDRQTARAQQEAKRAAEEFKRAQKEMDKAMKQNGDLLRGPNKEASERQLESLRRARENLERQMEKLDSEIEKLEQNREKMQEDQERRSELQEEKAKEEAAVAEAESN